MFAKVSINLSQLNRRMYESFRATATLARRVYGEQLLIHQNFRRVPIVFLALRIVDVSTHEDRTSHIAINNNSPIINSPSTPAHELAR